MAEVSSTANMLLKRLSRGMQALLLSIVALGATALLWTATLVRTPTWKEFLNAIATGLLVSAAFGIAQALITSRVATEILQASVVEEVHRSLAESSNAYYPVNEFPASTAPDSLFNSLLTRDLENSSTFWFRGSSGRYTAARLAFNRNVSLQAHLILPDPMAPGTLEGRVDYALRHQIYPGLGVDDIRNQIRSDIFEGDVVNVHYDDFHRLTDISSNTLTLIAKCPPVRDDSMSIDLRTLRVRKHVRAEARVPCLLRALAE